MYNLTFENINLENIVVSNPEFVLLAVDDDSGEISL